MRGSWVALTAALLLCAPVWAGTEPSAEDRPGVEELARRNQVLEERVRKLERESLEEDIESYLEQTDTAGSAAGAAGVVSAPGALAIRFSGEVRIRGEVFHNIYTPSDPSGGISFNFVHMRTRLRADVDVTEKAQLTIELQDVRAFGQEGSTTGILAGVDLKRGFMLLKNVGDSATSLQFGRFVMAYGDHRIVGDLEWVDQGRSYDGLRVSIDKKESTGWWVDLFAVNIRETFTVNNDLWFGGAYGGWKWLEAYALALFDQTNRAGETGVPDKTSYVTLGFRVARKTGRWDYKLEVPVQIGKLNGDDLLAWAAAFVVGYTFEDTAWKPRLYFEFDYASGDKDPTDGNVEQMQTLFPTNHKHYGYIDLMGWSNMMDFRFGAHVFPSPKVKVTFDYHHFRRPEDQGAWVNVAGAVIRPGVAGASNHLGDEFDLVVYWKPAKAVTVQVGYAIFIPGGFVSDTGNDPLAHFFWVTGRLKF